MLFSKGCNVSFFPLLLIYFAGLFALVLQFLFLLFPH